MEIKVIREKVDFKTLNEINSISRENLIENEGTLGLSFYQILNVLERENINNFFYYDNGRKKYYYWILFMLHNRR